MHASSILMLLSWPVIILISWFIIKFALDWYRKNRQNWKIRMKRIPSAVLSHLYKPVV
jgi:hypothetical protein